MQFEFPNKNCYRNRGLGLNRQQTHGGRGILGFIREYIGKYMASQKNKNVMMLGERVTLVVRETKLVTS